jgi:chemotaxis protein methyltransferase CheR
MLIAMTDIELSLFIEYVRALTGIQLDNSKRYLLETRLQDLMVQYYCTSYSELYAKSKSESAKTIEKRIIDEVSTNETFFYRDNKTFDLLKFKLVPDMLGENITKSLNIWSAASSTGQEAYTICMVLKDILFDLTKCRIRVFGTDISQAAVNAANRGEFTEHEVSRGLTPKHIERHFTREGDKYKINDDLRSICRFQVANLLSPLTISGSFDLIFLRNVLIYFSQKDIRTIITGIAKKLNPKGALIVGLTETLLDFNDILERKEDKGGVYYINKTG